MSTSPIPKTLVSTSPARNFASLGEIPMSTPDDVQAKVIAARTAFPAWAGLPLADRISHLSRLRDQFTERRAELAELMSLEMGMPITQSLFTVDRALSYMNWSLSNAPTYLAPEVTYEDEREIHEIHLEPHGVAACISPWNFPASNFVWATFQALLAGNTVVFKNSEETQLFAKAIEAMVSAAALPEGVLNVIYGDGAVAQMMISDDIDFISFTGSTRVGEILYKQAAEKFIPLVLELGGSDPGVVFADADLDRIIPLLYAGRFTNCGQVCQSMKRLIVERPVFDEVVQRLSVLLEGKKVGDPLLVETDIGPLVSMKQLATLEDQVADAIAKGAHAVCGGSSPEGLNGSYYLPTLLTNITPDMRVWHEEVFGPVLPIVPFDTFDQAMALANDTPYGLAASVFTENKETAQKAARALQAGMVKTNQANTSRAENIFGGYKKSGVGRENGKYGFHDVTQKKMVAREK